MGSMGIMLDLLFLFAAGILSFILYPLWINFVYRFQMGEDVREDAPKTHMQKIGTPTMGGLVFLSVAAVLTLFLNRSRTQTLLPIFVALISGLLGLFEDFTKVYRKSGLPGFFEYHFKWFFRKKESGSKGILRIISAPWRSFKDFWRIVGSSDSSGMQTYIKFIIQGLIGGFVAFWVYFKLDWDYIWFPLIGEVHIGILYPLFVFLLFIVVLNSVAFTDGLDGLAAGLSLIAFLSFWAVSRVLGYNSLAVFCATFAGAILPFLYFNIYPARIFMGNVGSHVLGGTLALLAVFLHREVAFLIIGAVFLFDGISSPMQQLSVKLTGKRLFRYAPVHHHFELLGWPETKVTLRFWLFGAFFAFAGIFIALM